MRIKNLETISKFYERAIFDQLMEFLNNYSTIQCIMKRKLKQWFHQYQQNEETANTKWRQSYNGGTGHNGGFLDCHKKINNIYSG
jgi:hypothetical protein